METSLTIDFLYVIPTYLCNLKCPHCTIRTKKDEYDDQRFINALIKHHDVPMVIFGGEPTLYPERINKICKYGNAQSISTNLINVDDQLIETIKKNRLNIATSWNPKRFNGSQYNVWINNIKLLAKHNLRTKVLITLTEDLIHENIHHLIMMFKQWSCIGSISDIQFEPLVDCTKTQSFYDQVDQWLVDIDNAWDNDIVPNYIVKQLANWKFNCSRVYTLQPNGTITFGCPQNTTPQINIDCLSCEYVSVCQPCRLQSNCTFPKRLYKKYYE